jgi:hypothetical protein
MAEGLVALFEKAGLVTAACLKEWAFIKGFAGDGVLR